MSYNGETIKIPSSHIKKYESDKVNNNVIDKVSANLYSFSTPIANIDNVTFEPNSIEVYNGLWVTVGSGYDNSGALAYYSTDGINFTAIDLSALDVSYLEDIAVYNGRWVMVGENDSSKTTAYYSDDGITFTACTLDFTFTACTLDSITVQDNKWCAVGGYHSYYSDDGITFTNTTSTYYWRYISSSSANPTIFSGLVFNVNGSVAEWRTTYSNNSGSSFSDTDANILDGTDWNALITNDDGDFIAVGDDKLAVSTDGITYSPITTVTNMTTIYDITFFAGSYVLVGLSSGVNDACYTNDLVNFTSINAITFPRVIANYNGYYIALGWSGNIYHSYYVAAFSNLKINETNTYPQTNGTGTNNYKLKTSELFRSDIKIDNKLLFNSIAENLILHRTNGLATAKIDVVILPYYDTSTPPVVVIDQDTTTNIFKSGMLVEPYITDTKPLGRYSDNTAMVFRVTNATVDFSGIGKQTLSLIEKPQ